MSPAGTRTCIVGDCIEVMRDMAEASVDAIVTDPPYGLGFMGKAWDDLPPGPEFAAEALRVLKPGAHLLAFGGTRTYHRLVVALEDAGFEIRDTIAWLYGSGFPKSRNLDGDWQGWGTALKPAHEPKPVSLMRWLVRMVTPPGGTVLDPFLGSGTTGVAAALERVNFVGIEREPEYAEIARARIAYAFWGNA